MPYRDAEIKLADPAAQIEEILRNTEFEQVVPVARIEEMLGENRRLAGQVERSRVTASILVVAVFVLLIVVVGLSLALSVVTIP